MDSLIGQSLGRYHILEQLGEGGMATVYKAFDTRLEANVAVKVIRIERLAPEIAGRALKRFEREAKALAQLNHPNIVKVIDYGEYEGQPFLVMPYLEGGTLKGLMQARGALPWQDAARLLLPISKALAYAHQRRMIHRDVKPSNVLITDSGEPMLSDFGVTKIIEEEATIDLTGTSATVGTPEYMAPEQTTSKSIDHRVDIYGLGIVFYEMVTGRKPFIADTPLAVLFKQASEPLPRPTQFAPSIPDKVEQIILQMLAKKPEDRYQTMSEFASDLELLLARQSVEKNQTEVGKIESHPVKPLTGTQATLSQEESSETRIEEATHDEMPPEQPAIPARYSTETESPKLNDKWRWGVGILIVIVCISIFILFAGGSVRLGKQGLGLTGGDAVATSAPAMATVTQPAAPKIKVTVAIDATFPPFDYVDNSTKEIIGFDIDLFKAIAAKEGFQVEFKNVAWEVLLAGIGQCQYDAAISSIAITDERNQNMLFSDPYFTAGQQVVVDADNTTIKSKDDLNGKKVGAEINTAGAIEIGKIIGAELVNFDSIGLAFQSLMNGSVDAVVTDNVMALGFVSKYSDKLKAIGEPFMDESIAIAVCKTRTDLLDRINAGLAAVKEEGTIDILIGKWMKTQKWLEIYGIE